MPPQGYTITERKSIVNYIKNGDFYNEIKGRKMWMDFASTKLTTRSWQSLKETFLKRILPDIHNPFYGLTPEEIQSFRVGYSMIRKNNNKLFVPKSTTSRVTPNERKKTADEDLTSNNRCPSAATIILESTSKPYYADANEIEKVLISEDEEDTLRRSTPNTSKHVPNAKALKVFSPIVNSILKDFDADSIADRETPNIEIEENSGKEIKTTSKMIVQDNNLSSDKIMTRLGMKRESSQDSSGSVSKKKKENDVTSKNKNSIQKKSVNLSDTSNGREKYLRSPNILPDSTLLEPSSEALPGNQQALRARENEQQSDNPTSNDPENRKTGNSTPKPQVEKRTIVDPWYCKPSTSKATFDAIVSKNQVTNDESSFSISKETIPKGDGKQVDSNKKELNCGDEIQSKSKSPHTIQLSSENSSCGRRNKSPRDSSLSSMSSGNVPSTDHLSDVSSLEDESDDELVNRGTERIERLNFNGMRKGRFVPINNSVEQLFMYGQHAYPLCNENNGQIRCTILKRQSKPNDYWKKKYYRLKKSKDKLKRFNNHSKRRASSASENKQMTYVPNGVSYTERRYSSTMKLVDEKGDVLVKNKDDHIKYTFAKGDHTSTIEGSWTTVQSALKEILCLYQVTNKTVPTQDASMQVQPDDTTNCCPITSVVIDDESKSPTNDGNKKETNRNVEVIEKEIFNEIENIDKSSVEEEVKQNANVTKRKTQLQRKGIKRKQPQVTHGDNEVIVNENKLQLIEDKTAQAGTSSSAIDANLNASREVNTIEEQIQEGLTSIFEDGTDIKYRFPSPVPQEDPAPTEDKADQEASDNQHNPRRTGRNRRNKRVCMKSDQEQNLNTNNSSPINSEDVHGYQCSQNSPILNLKYNFKNTPSNLNTSLQQNEIAYIPNIRDCDRSSDEQPVLYIGTNIYRTDSFDMLMQNCGKTMHNSKLNKISEIDSSSSDNSVESREFQNLRFNLSPASQNMEALVEIDQETNNNGPNNSQHGSLNSVSLPDSPEISIVENITLNKDLLNTLPFVFPSTEQSLSTEINADELLALSSIHKDSSEKNIEMVEKMSVDRSNPPSDIREIAPHILRTLETPLYDNFVNGEIGIEANVSEMLNERLNNMILDSAKKQSEVALPKGKSKVKKSKKRCSTPHRRTKKYNPDVMDERMEHCVKAKSRHSCPPIIHTIVDDTRLTQVETLKSKPEKKKKRNTIKVKILRPKDKINGKKRRVSKSSISDNDRNDSESGIFLHGFNDTVDLIHNHSDTCLQTNECRDDSNDVVIIENDDEVISLDNSDLEPADCTVPSFRGIDNNNFKGISLDCFLSDAQDGTAFSLAPTPESYENSSRNSRPSASSLVTEDLSDEIENEPTDWYLLSDEENTNIETQSRPITSNYMEKLFPVTFAVPDLSTITELSREVGDSNSNIK